MKRWIQKILVVLVAAACCFSCASTSTGTGGNVNTDVLIQLERIAWPEWSVLPVGYTALEGEAGPVATKDAAIQLAELRAKIKVAELVSGLSITGLQKDDDIYVEESGVILVDRNEWLDTITSTVNAYISRVEIPQTFSGKYEKNWYAKTRAIFTLQWAEQETARLEPQRADIRARWKEALEKAHNRMEALNREALAAYNAANAPAREEMQKGRDYDNLGRYTDALEAYNHAVWLWQSKKLNPPSEVYEFIGRAEDRLGNYREAVLAYKKALEVDPDNMNARDALNKTIANEQRIKAQENERRRQAFLKRFVNFEVYGGSSFAAPWVVIGVDDRVYLFPWTCLDVGCDVGIIPGGDYQSSVNYWSVYPYARFNAYTGREKVQWYAGVGGGGMMARYSNGDEDNSFIVPVFDMTGGLRANFSSHWGLALSYSLRTPYNSFFQTLNHKVTIGYLIH
jgi:tetratricopeptide (TPR) repeat protein